MIKYENGVYCSINELNTITGYSKAWLNTILGRPEFAYYRKTYSPAKKLHRTQVFKYCKGLFELLAQFRKRIYY